MARVKFWVPAMTNPIHMIAVLCLQGQDLHLGLHHSSAQLVTLSHLFCEKLSWHPPPWVPLRKKKKNKFQRSNEIVFKLKKGNMTWRCIQTARGLTDVLNTHQASGNPWKQDCGSAKTSGKWMSVVITLRVQRKKRLIQKTNHKTSLWVKVIWHC